MDKVNIGDSVLSEVMKGIGKVTDYVSKEFKSVKPFDKEKIDPREQLFWYEQLGIEDMNYLVQKYGEDAVNKYVYEMTMLQDKTKGVS